MGQLSVEKLVLTGQVSAEINSRRSATAPSGPSEYALQPLAEIDSTTGGIARMTKVADFRELAVSGSSSSSGPSSNGLLFNICSP